MGIKNILTEALPEWIWADGVKYPIYTDFKRWIKIDLLMADRDIKCDEKLAEMLSLCYKKLPPTLEQAIDGITYFYSGGTNEEKEKSKKQGKPCFDFIYDSELIYAAFYTQYGIDLVYDDLHWWQFCALLKGLTEEHRFTKVVGYRLSDLSMIEDSAKKRFYRKMKEIYKLPDRRTEKERDAAIIEGIADLF